MTSKIIHSQRLVLQNNIVLWKSSIFQYFLLIYRPSSWVCILLRGPRLIKQPPSYTGKLERLEYNFSLAWLITQEFNILTDEKFSHALRTYHILLKLLKGHDKKSQWHHKALIFQFKFSFNHLIHLPVLLELNKIDLLSEILRKSLNTVVKFIRSDSG